jgi:hypothetical protein
MEMLTLEGRVKAKHLEPYLLAKSVQSCPCRAYCLCWIALWPSGHIALWTSSPKEPPLASSSARRSIGSVSTQSFRLSIIIERSLDNFSQAAISQQDVKHYYDDLQLLKIPDWIHKVIHDLELGDTLLRTHICPLIFLQVAAFETLFKHRTVGMCTEGRSAGASGRLPLLETANARMAVWEKRGFNQCGKPFALATFVDNLIVLAPTAQDAVEVQNDIAWHLLNH